MDDKDIKGIWAPSYEALITTAAKNEYLRVEDLPEGAVLSVLTENHRYDFTVLEPARRRVRITSDHPKWHGPHDGYLLGSLLTPWGSSLMVGRVAVGLNLTFSSPDFVSSFIPPEIRTSLVREVLLDGKRVLPAIRA